MEKPEQLIQACKNEDRNAQRQLYELYRDKMFALCLRYARNKEEAEEILQEGFVQVFRSLHNFKHAGSFEGWVRKIMVYCAIRHYRSRPPMHPFISIDAADSEPLMMEDVTAYLHKKELLKMIQALPPAYRITFNLYVFEGMKHREIAEALGISEGTSKSNFYDAKLLLQKAVTKSMQVAKNY